LRLQILTFNFDDIKVTTAIPEKAKGNLMKKTILSSISKITSLLLVLAVLIVYSTVALALPDNKTAMGELVVGGKRPDGDASFVLVNGEPVTSGNTVFSSSTITTDQFNSATVELGKLGSVSVAPGSVLNLNFDDKSITGTLSAGNVRVSNNKGVQVKIGTPGGFVGNGINPEASTLNASAQTNTPPNGGAQTNSLSKQNLYLIIGAAVAAVVIIALVAGGGNNNTDATVAGNTVSPTR